VSPQRDGSRTQPALLHLLEHWEQDRGEIGLEGSVTLTKKGHLWVLVPDLLYVLGDRLPSNLGNQPCPVPPDLVIEIISPEQSFAAIIEKATDYVAAGILRVWIVDPQQRSIAVFAPNATPIIVREELNEPLLPGFKFNVRSLISI